MQPKSGRYRHEWQDVILFARFNEDLEARPEEFVKLCLHRLDRYTCHSRIEVFRGELAPWLEDDCGSVHPMLEYEMSDLPMHRFVYLSTEVGKGQPLIDWHLMPEAAQYTLESYDFGHNKVPFNDANFRFNVEMAWRTSTKKE